MKSHAISLKGKTHERNMDFFRADDGLGLYAVADVGELAKALAKRQMLELICE